MARETFNHLKRYLQENKLTSLLSIVQDQLTIESKWIRSHQMKGPCRRSDFVTKLSELLVLLHSTIQTMSVIVWILWAPCYTMALTAQRIHFVFIVWSPSRFDAYQYKELFIWEHWLLVYDWDSHRAITLQTFHLCTLAYDGAPRTKQQTLANIGSLVGEARKDGKTVTKQQPCHCILLALSGSAIL